MSNLRTKADRRHATGRSAAVPRIQRRRWKFVTQIYSEAVAAGWRCRLVLRGRIIIHTEEWAMSYETVTPLIPPVWSSGVLL
jgi:hypothetical protein